MEKRAAEREKSENERIGKKLIDGLHQSVSYKSIPSKVFGGPDQLFIELQKKTGNHNKGTMSYRGDDIKIYTMSGQYNVTSGDRDSTQIHSQRDFIPPPSLGGMVTTAAAIVPIPQQIRDVISSENTSNNPIQPILIEKKFNDRRLSQQAKIAGISSSKKI